jgi:peptide/nickel transport system substrate-binding protein
MLYLAWRPPTVLSLDNKWIPMTITQIPTIENGKARKKGEGIDIDIEFKKELQWGDGTPLTCKDLEFTWRVGKHPNVANSDRETYENISAITIDPKNPKKCTVSFAKAKFDYFTNLMKPLPVHLEGPIFEKYKDQPQGYDRNTLYTKDPTNPGLWNGPYRVTEVKLGSHVMFTRNEKFGGKKAAIPNILFKLIPNGNALTTNLQAGDIDFICPAGGLGFDQALAYDKKVKAEKLPYTVVFKPSNVYAHIDLNLDKPGLKEYPVRKALALGMNKKDMIQSFFEGKAELAIHNTPKSDPWYTDKVPTYQYNRREAIKTLEEAGWKAGPDGIRAKNGQKLSYVLMAAAGAKINENIEAYLQAQWKAIGVEIRIKNEPARVFFGETTKHRAFDMALYSWVSLPENSPRTTLHSSMIPSEKNSWSGQNQPGYINPEMDKLIDSLELEFSAKKRAAIAAKILNFYAKDLPVLSLYFRPNNAVIPADLKHYKLSGHQHYETLWAEDWVW